MLYIYIYIYIYIYGGIHGIYHWKIERLFEIVIPSGIWIHNHWIPFRPSNWLSYQDMSPTHTESKLCTASPISSCQIFFSDIVVFYGVCRRNWTNNYLSIDVSSIWYAISFLNSSASFLLFSLLLVGNNFFLMPFVNVVLYFDLYCLSSSATLLVVALSKLYFS